MTLGAPRRPRGAIVTFGRFQLRLGGKTLAAGILIVAIVWASIAVAPKGNPWNGVVAAISAVAGTFLGVVMQVEPKPVDYRPVAMGAVHALASIADTVAVASTLGTQLSDQTREQRTAIGLVAVQDELRRAVTDLHVAMLQWDSISEGITEAVIEDRQKGHELFKRLAERSGSD